MQVRRVVSGQDAAGRAVIVSDERIAVGVQGDLGGASLWHGDAVPRFPLDGRPPPAGTLFPGPNGYRFAIMVVRPASTAVEQRGGAQAQALAAEYLDIVEADSPGMHATDTVDFEVVLSGEASMELDDGVHVHLAAGDTFVQNGTRHRWYNRGSVDAVVAVFMVGGHPRG